MGMQEVKCLGFVISSEGLKADPVKLRAIREFPRPATVKQLRAFLGLINFYGSFVPGLQICLQPLHEMTTLSSTLE